MATEAVVNDRALDVSPAAHSRRGWKRPLAAGVAIALFGLLAGDRGARTANIVQGIDPLEILDLQVKPNVLFVVDSSTAMGLNAEGTLYVGGDDPASRFYRTKQALRELIADNDGVANFGIIDLNADQSQLALGVTSFHSDRPGPLVYVSADANAATWRNRFDDMDPDFDDYNGDPECVGQPPLPITNVCSEEIHESFKTDGRFGTPYQGRFYLASRLFRHGVKYIWDATPGNFENKLQGIDATITCPPPPAGLLGDDLDEFNGDPPNEPRACFQIEDFNSPGTITTYYLTSPIYSEVSSGAECDGSNLALCLVAPVPACTEPSNVTALRTGPLRLQLPLVTNTADPRLGLPEDPGGLFPNFPIIATTPLIGVQPNAAGGMQIGGRRPLGEALRAAQAHYTSTVFPSRPAAVDGKQRNFVIVITSGADDAGPVDPVTQATAMRGGSATPGANDITTMVVTINGEAGFGASADQTALNALQSAGTLGRHTVTFGAATADELRSSLNFAFSEAIASGIFSTESSITESIFEYAAQANRAALPGPPPTPARSFDPFDPAERFASRVPTLLQSSFEMPGFIGHLRAFQAKPTAPGAPGCPAGSIERPDPNGVITCEVWDAGDKLRRRIWGTSPLTVGMCPSAAAGDFATCSLDTHTFTEMRGSGPQVGSLGSSVYPQFTPLSSGALIQRRILTTARHGVFAYQSNLNEPFGPGREPAGGQCPVPLWPPTFGTGSVSVGNCTYTLPVAPSDDNTAGLLDRELGIAGADNQAVFNQLQSRFAACLGSPLPAACTAVDGSGNPDFAVRTPRARREARETILAFTAGADQAVVSGSGIPQRDTNGDILYKARFWALAESTLGVPAVVPPPLQSLPITHTAEYLLYRDGVRDTAGFVIGAPSANPVASGFALRNPDKNAGPDLSTGGAADDLNFEPLMTVVYHASNDMVHAFRGGPCPPASCTETGGDELWGFVPYDQLEKLQERMQGQGRSPHTYMLASSVRFSDVFVPDADGEWTETATGRKFLGRWRTVMVFGRGIAGKYYTALDITSPGQFNRSSLDTLPPFAIWSRGNPDTQQGVLGGPPNGVGGADYAKMGETWSVPAMAAVNPTDFSGRQFAMFMGSGYATDPANADEGKIFYAVDALTGDVLHALDEAATDSTGTCASIEPGETCPVRNALVANSAAYIPIQLQAGFVGNPAASTASLVYIGDLHGRMWKFITNSTGLGLVKIQPDSGAFADSPDQPIGNAVALLNISGPTGQTPHVYWETGNDRRVIPPDPFKFVAMADVGADIDGTVVATGLFTEPLDGALLGFRGTTQPATAFNATGLGRVFFIGTKFTDRNVANGDCASRFDSVLFALGAVSGGAVYDLDSSGSVTSGDKSVMISGKVNAIRGSLGQIVLDKGDVSSSAGGVQAPPAPPAPVPAPTTNEGSSGEVFVGKIRPNSNVCR